MVQVVGGIVEHSRPFAVANSPSRVGVLDTIQSCSRVLGDTGCTGGAIHPGYWSPTVALVLDRVMVLGVSRLHLVHCSGT